MNYTVTLERVAQRRSNAAIIRRQIDDILNRALASSRGKQFKLATQVPETIEPTLVNGDWYYKLDLVFEHIGRGNADVQFNNVKDAIFKAAPSKGNWCLAGGYTPTGPNLVAINGDTDVIAEVTIDRGTHFDHLYGLDAQIDVLLSALQVAKDTNYTKRFHSVLYGKPGCGKSEILRGVKNMVGEEGVIEFDGTQTTAAGAIATLMESAIVPPLLIIEEIEKVPDAAFMWLLGALDGRAEIRKVTARGVSHRKVPFVCAATVNDIELFKSRHEGAMASRFAHKIYCPRPTAEILRRILLREIKGVQGNPEWIQPAIDYCMKEENNTDPRRVIAVCLTGRDKLLTGEFQSNLKACREETDVEKLS
jgi:hypothetical protein